MNIEINKENLGTYKQKLAFIGQLYQNGLSLLDFEVANEMECALGYEEIEYTDEQFESWCAIAADAVLKAEEMTEWAMCRTIAQIIKEDGENKLLEMGKWDLIAEASYLL